MLLLAYGFNILNNMATHHLFCARFKPVYINLHTWMRWKVSRYHVLFNFHVILSAWLKESTDSELLFLIVWSQWIHRPGWSSIYNVYICSLPESHIPLICASYETLLWASAVKRTGVDRVKLWVKIYGDLTFHTSWQHLTWDYIYQSLFQVK